MKYKITSDTKLLVDFNQGAADLSGNVVATNNGTTQTNFGRFGKSNVFAGGTNVSVSGTLLNLAAFTIHLLFKPNSTALQVLIGNRYWFGGTSNRWTGYLVQVVNGVAAIQINPNLTGVGYAASGSIANTNKYNLLSCSFSGSNLKIYINGDLKGQTSGVLVYNALEVFKIGTLTGETPYPANSNIEFVQVDARVWTDTEIKQFFTKNFIKKAI